MRFKFLSIWRKNTTYRADYAQGMFFLFGLTYFNDLVMALNAPLFASHK